MMSIGFGTYEISAQASSGYEFSHWSNNSGNIEVQVIQYLFKILDLQLSYVYNKILLDNFIPLDTDGDGLSDIDEVNIHGK